MINMHHFYFQYFKKDFIYLVLEGKGGRKWARTTMCGCLLGAPYWGPGLQPSNVPYTENQTSYSLVHRPALDPLSHTGQGYFKYFR